MLRWKGAQRLLDERQARLSVVQFSENVSVAVARDDFHAHSLARCKGKRLERSDGLNIAQRYPVAYACGLEQQMTVCQVQRTRPEAPQQWL